MKQECLFTRYNGALLYIGLPHQNYEIDIKNLKKQIVKTKSIFARYTTDSQLITPPHVESELSDSECNDNIHWWHCLRKDPIDLGALNSKQRYRIKKGLKLNRIEHVDGNFIIENLDAVADLLQASFSDYPGVYKPTVDNKKLATSYAYDNREKWVVFDVETNNIIGLCICSINDDVVGLHVVKVDPAYLKNEVNAALVYELCTYYLNNKHLKYICDGERNLVHITNYQEFLVRVLGFKKVPCRLHVVYHPLILPIITMLYPFRGLIGKIKMRYSLIYKIHCVLMQEQIARQYR